jgi:EmrB/QacA subfamily drug resistance transporter
MAATRTLLHSDLPRSVSQSGRGRWLALICIAVAQLMIALDATVVNIALPSIQAGLQFSDADRQWIVSAYTLAFGGLLLLGGRIADSVKVGRRRAFLIGLIGFAAASALGGAAANLGLLAGARAVQGAFAALLAPTALSLLAIMFTEPHERARAFGIYGAIAASGGAIGLLLGGVLTQFLEWRWCLYVNVPIALLAALAGLAVLPDARQPTRESSRTRFDLLGLLLASSGLVAVVYACGQAATRGWAASLVLALFGGGALALCLFAWHEAQTTEPLLPPRLVLDRQRGAAYLCTLLAIGGIFGAFLVLTYELQVVLGFTPLMAGLAFLPMSISTFLVATLIAPRTLPRFSPRVLMVPGFLAAAAGMAVLSQLDVSVGYATGILPAEILLGLGISCVMVPASSLATSRVGLHDAGIASAALNSAQQIGGSLGTAVLSSVAAAGTATYLTSTATAARPEALMHGYDTGAVWGAMFLVAGAIVALSIPSRGEEVL